MIVLGPVLALATAYVLSATWGRWGVSWAAQTILLIDLIYAVVLISLIGWRVSRAIATGRSRPGGNRLHMRLAGVFAASALVPTIIVAVFAALTVGVGVEKLFTDRIGSVLRNSLATAEAYEREHQVDLRRDVLDMARDLNRAAAQRVTNTQLNQIVNQQALVRELRRAYVFNLDKQILARGEFSYLFNFVPPTDGQLEAANRGEVVLMRDPANDELRALVALDRVEGAFLYVSRFVQGEVLQLLDQTSDTLQTYDKLEAERSGILFDYVFNFLLFALLVVLAALLTGLWFAERLAKPVGRLAGAAERVGSGDLDVRVKEERGSDEIAMLSRVFNRMTGQLKGQRDALIKARDESEGRRQFSEAVLSGVTAGVIGLDAKGQIDLINDAGAELLGITIDGVYGQPLEAVAPAFDALRREAALAPSLVARGTVHHVGGGEEREFLARVAPKAPDRPEAGSVLTFDDLTALASAQRMAAWGDVARRIAHEIKNPLTPIQLSTDRLRRKFQTRLGEDAETFGQILDVISRQTGDIGRMVDEFSKFARMPEPVMGEHDLADLVRETLALQTEANGAIAYGTDLPAKAPMAMDPGLVGQVLTNLLKNAADAIEARADRDGDAAPAPAIHVALDEGPRSWRLQIADNGIGLPSEGRDRLTDPYVTTRAKGTGLGLAIVKKIIEQHGGEIVLGDVDVGDLDGAAVRVRLPKPAQRIVERVEAGEAV